MQASIATIDTEQDLTRASQALMAGDERFRALHDELGLPPLRRRAGGLEGLAWIVTGQLVSTQSAKAIWRRVEPALRPFDVKEVSQMPTAELAACGLTRAKANTIICAAQAVCDGGFDFGALAELDDAQAARALMGLKGIGRWSADIYLLSCLGRTDIWPGGDLAVRMGTQRFLQLAELPSIAEMEELASAWRPYRSIAARYLWALHAQAKAARVAGKG